MDRQRVDQIRGCEACWSPSTLPRPVVESVGDGVPQGTRRTVMEYVRVIRCSVAAGIVEEGVWETREAGDEVGEGGRRRDLFAASHPDRCPFGIPRQIAIHGSYPNPPFRGKPRKPFLEVVAARIRLAPGNGWPTWPGPARLASRSSAVGSCLCFFHSWRFENAEETAAPIKLKNFT
jgi:hypothetical protein